MKTIPIGFTVAFLIYFSFESHGNMSIQEHNSVSIDQGERSVIEESKSRFIEFDITGESVVAIRHEGSFNGCNMPVGIDSLYDSKGRLNKTIFYDNRKSKTEVGCDATWTTIETKCYYKSGKIKSVFFEKTCYECASCACGEWIRYNKRGEIIERVEKGDCYNQVPCPQ